MFLKKINKRSVFCFQSCYLEVKLCPTKNTASDNWRTRLTFLIKITWNLKIAILKNKSIVGFCWLDHTVIVILF